MITTATSPLCPDRRRRAACSIAGLVAAALLLLALAPLPVLGQGGPHVFVAPETVTATVGSPLTVTVEIADVDDLAAMQLTLGYDEATLTLEDITAGSFLGSTGREVTVLPPVTETGRVTLLAYAVPEPGGPPAASGSGTLARLRFGARAVGTSTLALSEVILEDSVQGGPPITVTRVSAGHVTVAPERTFIYLPRVVRDRQPPAARAHQPGQRSGRSTYRISP